MQSSFNYNKILIIQTAFTGDVILATALLEKLHQFYPHAHIDILVRKGNESLFTSHPFINEVIVWNKKVQKYRSAFRVFATIRSRKYDLVINLQRFFMSGLLTVLSGAGEKRGYSKNPLSFYFLRNMLISLKMESMR
jgi:ADP-heptose:LPS heptosyltransferase